MQRWRSRDVKLSGLCDDMGAVEHDSNIASLWNAEQIRASDDHDRPWHRKLARIPNPTATHVRCAIHDAVEPVACDEASERSPQALLQGRRIADTRHGHQPTVHHSLTSRFATATSLLLTLGALMLSCSSGSSGSAGDAGMEAAADPSEALCSSMCTVVMQVACPDQPTMMDCVTECLGEMTCPAQTKAYFACLVATGAVALECNQVVGGVVLKDGYCTKESADFLTCIQM